MRILLTGVSGLTGRYVINHALRPADCLILGTSKRHHDHPDFQALHAYEAVSYADFDRYAKIISEFKPDVIAHLGGEGNVDVVQNDPKESRISNLDFPLFLLEQAQKHHIKIVQFSSNAVYDGANAPYSEKSPMNPVNLYGEMKKEVDLATRAQKGAWLILRPIVTYGWNYSFGRPNPVTQFISLLQSGKPVKLVNDQFENPIYAGDVATIFWRCILQNINGEFNLGGGDKTVNRFDWIRTVAEIFELDTSLIATASVNDFKTIAPRPRDTTFQIAKLCKTLKIEPASVLEGALAMKKDTAFQPILETQKRRVG